MALIFQTYILSYISLQKYLNIKKKQPVVITEAAGW